MDVAETSLTSRFSTNLRLSRFGRWRVSLSPAIARILRD